MKKLMDSKNNAWFLVLLFVASTDVSALPDFGADGLKGLDQAQIRNLQDGQIVFTVGDPAISGQAVGQSSGKPLAFIQAALVMDKPPSEVWKYLCRTEEQYLYLRETESCDVVSRSQDRILIEYRVRFLLAGTSFRLYHHFNAARLSMSWNLDPDFDNGFKEFRGFWFLYPLDDGRTLARYGNYVSLAGIPDFIVRFFMKSGITRSLASVRDYVESDGMYRK